MLPPARAAMDPTFLYQPRAAGVAANEALKRQATSAVRSNKRVRQKRVHARVDSFTTFHFPDALLMPLSSRCGRRSSSRRHRKAPTRRRASQAACPSRSCQEQQQLLVCILLFLCSRLHPALSLALRRLRRQPLLSLLRMPLQRQPLLLLLLLLTWLLFLRFLHLLLLRRNASPRRSTRLSQSRSASGKRWLLRKAAKAAITGSSTNSV